MEKTGNIPPANKLWDIQGNRKGRGKRERNQTGLTCPRSKMKSETERSESGEGFDDNIVMRTLPGGNIKLGKEFVMGSFSIYDRGCLCLPERSQSFWRCC